MSLFVGSVQEQGAGASTMGGAWRIRKVTLETFRQTGNRSLLRDAAAPQG